LATGAVLRRWWWRRPCRVVGEAPPYWRVLCHPDSPDPPELVMAGDEVGEVVRVLAHEAGVDVEELTW
jgi:hypothetical protein